MLHIVIRLSVQLPLVPGAAVLIAAAVVTQSRLRRLGFRVLSGRQLRARLVGEPATVGPEAPLRPRPGLDPAQPSEVEGTGGDLSDEALRGALRNGGRG
jgi:hypothetical protein